MSIEPGTYSLGPQNGTLSVRTGRRGAIAKVGHDLLIEVGAWGATVEIGADPRQTVLELTADARSLRVKEATGGIQSLGQEERSGIDQTIDEEVLRAVKVRAARSGMGDSEVIEEALRRELGFDLLEHLWQRNDLDEEEALTLAVESQHKTRPRRR
jgi:hypothetical protein